VLAGFGAAGATRIMVISVAAVMGLATTLGRQGFDSLVQRQAPLALHGRSFARFETQFQLGWVIGAAFATAAAVPTRVSLAVFAAVLVPSAALYLRAAAEARRYGSPPLHDDLDAAVYGRLVAAEQWIDTGHVRFAAVDMAAAADLLLAAGTRLPAELVAELRQLRSDAIDPSGQLSREAVIEQVTRLRSAITR
jgi:membrane protein implicated in regulation of membrane protease activity